VLIDKPAGMTSHDVVERVRRALGTRSVGHTGTLDPFATGLLVVLLGRATRLARFVQFQSKTYLATALLGARTDTDDLTGRLLETRPISPELTERRIQEELVAVVGRQRQQPPQYSAKLVAGERSYRKARRGETVELADSEVVVHAMELVSFRSPELIFRTVVSTGTYLRAVARDLGERLGVGAHLTALRRESIGSLRVEDAVGLDNLGQGAVLPPQGILGDLPHLSLDEADRRDIIHGRAVVDSRTAGERASGEVVALLGDGELVAVARAADGWLQPTVVLEQP
jgi:tRNA pseudouridine55 synthase